ncbi:MAG: AMP-binding protein [Burkholderiaceae bacterium]|jgi:acyl-coenzyme A synthetase/AMP-(fatty) acid ligase|nr:AMP-binding protein [Burkholderiaceae bacterium]
MTERLPLLAARDLDAPLLWCGGRPVSAARFLGQAEALAGRLPAAGRAVNLCRDRHRFALGLAAALRRGHTSLMPPNALPETLAALHEPGAPVPYALVDDAALDTGGLAAVFVAPDEAAAPSRQVPGVAADFEAVRLLTSGSTGTPRPHAKRWGPLVANIAAEAARLAEFSGRASLAGLGIVATVPAQHSYGFESSVLLALLGGASCDAGRPFYPADIVAALERVPAPRALVTTPFHLKTLLRAGLPLPPLELLLSATAPLSPQLAAEAEAATGARLVEIYGCTEAGQVAARRTTAGEVWTALGELRLWREPGPDAGEGERFLVQGGHVTEPTPLADQLELLDERRFRLLGRANDLIHVAGKRSSLAQLDFQLNRIPGVADGAFWMPDEPEDGVARPVALVVSDTLDAEAVRRALRQVLEPAFVPRRVLMVPALPREGTGKLTAQGLSRFARDALNSGPRFRVAPDHPAFAGHFPGHPVLPGVALLAYVMRALAADAALAARLGAQPQIAQAKFLAPVGPGAQLEVRLQATGERGVAFEVWQLDAEPPRAAASGRLVAGLP